MTKLTTPDRTLIPFAAPAWDEGVHPIMRAYLRGELTDEQLVEALVSYRYDTTKAEPQADGGAWFEEAARISSMTTGRHEVYRFAWHRLIPAEVYNAVARELGWSTESFADARPVTDAAV
jgi:hypothetical protein